MLIDGQKNIKQEPPKLEVVRPMKDVFFLSHSKNQPHHVWQWWLIFLYNKPFKVHSFIYLINDKITIIPPILQV